MWSGQACKFLAAQAGGDAESLCETTEAGFQSLCNSVLNWAPQGYIPIGFLSVYAGVGFQLFETMLSNLREAVTGQLLHIGRDLADTPA